MLGIGSTELFLIVAFALLIFGPDKLPQLGRTIGKFTKEFRRAQDTMEATIRAEMQGIEDIGKPKPKTDSEETETDSKETEEDDDWDEEEEEEGE